MLDAARVREIEIDSLLKMPAPAGLHKIRSMGWRAADRIANGGVDRQVEVRAVRTERIGIANSQFIATLPPAMLADDNAWIEFFAETRPGSHSAGRGAHVNPVAVPDSACCGSRRIQFDLRVQCALAQARQCTMLGLTKETGLGAGQDQREGRSQVRARNRADWLVRQSPARPDNRDQGRSRTRIRFSATASGSRAGFPCRRSRRAWCDGSSAVSAIRQVPLEADPR